MQLDLYKISAILGLICITIGIMLVRPSQKRKQYVLFILGGILLEFYSIKIQDAIFITLQAVFTISAIFELAMLYKKAKKLGKSIIEYLKDLENHLTKFNKK